MFKLILQVCKQWLTSQDRCYNSFKFISNSSSNNRFYWLLSSSNNNNNSKSWLPQLTLNSARLVILPLMPQLNQELDLLQEWPMVCRVLKLVLLPSHRQVLLIDRPLTLIQGLLVFLMVHPSTQPPLLTNLLSTTQLLLSNHLDMQQLLEVVPMPMSSKLILR